MSKKKLNFPKIRFSRHYRPPAAPLGVIDIGSNSVRLVAFGGSARSPVPIYNEKTFCKLGESVAATGRIESEAEALTIATLKRFRAVGKRLGIAHYSAVATAAVRDAENSAEFVRLAEQALGAEIQVLSGQMEAKYAAKGVMMGFEKVDGIVGDLGGGSLELVRVIKGEIVESATLPLGVLRLTPRFGSDTAAMNEYVKQQLAPLTWLQQGSDKPIYMVGGTWRALARVHMARMDYGLKMLHHYKMRPADMLDFTRLISNLSPESVEHINAANAVRRPYLPASASVLNELIKLTGCGRLIISANGLREGILYSSLTDKLRAEDPLMVACRDIGKRLCKDADYADELQLWTSELFSGQNLSSKKSKYFNRLRNAACLINDMAWNQHNDYRGWFAANSILRAPLNCINHNGRRFLAHALYMRHNGAEDELPEGMTPISETHLKLSRALGLSFRLAHALSGSLPGLLAQTELTRKGNKLRLVLPKKHSNLHGPIIDKRLAALAQELGLDHEIKFVS